MFRLRRTGRYLVIFVTACLLTQLQIHGESPQAPSLKLVRRTVTQDQGAWVVDYRLRYTGQSGIIVTPEEIAVKVEGWVSNSRVISHALPRWSLLTFPRGTDLSAVSDVIPSADESLRCRERLLVSISTEPQPTPNSLAHSSTGLLTDTGSCPAAFSNFNSNSSTGISPLSLRPEAVVRVRLRFDHQHMIYGDYDPLLGVRKVELSLGTLTVHDVVPLDREQYLAQPKFRWPDLPEERRDSHHAVSGPDSLHLEAHVPGHHYYRFPERPVRYSSKMRLRFWYLIAAGTEGDCRVRVTQTKDTPISFRPLRNADYEQTLRQVGRWTKVEHVIQTEPEATKMAIEFQIAGDTEVGEMWIDDVSLEPVGCTAPCGP
jgi:hypothetical protein